MLRTFREVSCGHFPWKLKDENQQNFSPNFHCSFHPSLAQISPELRSGENWPNKSRFVPLRNFSNHGLSNVFWDSCERAAEFFPASAIGNAQVRSATKVLQTTSKSLPLRQGIGVRVKGVTGRDATVHKRRRNSSQKATQ